MMNLTVREAGRGFSKPPQFAATGHKTVEIAAPRLERFMTIKIGNTSLSFLIRSSARYLMKNYIIG